MSDMTREELIADFRIMQDHPVTALIIPCAAVINMLEADQALIAELEGAWRNITQALNECERGQTIEQVLANYRAVRRTCDAIAKAKAVQNG